MEESSKRINNKGLVVFLLVLVLVIIGLVIGIVVIAVNNRSNEQEATENVLDEDAEKIIAEHQARIDEAVSEEERIELYLGRFNALVNIMNQSGQDLCMQIMSDAGVVMDNVDQDARLEIFEAIPEDCMIVTEPQEASLYSELGGEDV